MLHGTKSKYRCTTIITRISPLLQLPVELRLLIYKYLVPDGDILPIRVRERPETLRKDGGSICPAVLYLNRQIHNEVIPLWYGSGNFHSELWDFSVRVPSALRFIKSLDIPIFAQLVPQKGMLLERQGLPNYSAFILYFLEKHGILERLAIRLTEH
ncbi:uncharacterized protein Bfra_009702 [Botrytis fragariae]|uniref:F-box domain-containing protein n=1 Tax=Botrytis fragariae TaxID=1964551 RepID=A0A8H6EFK3_9HELO|nr:uncharacterized protein Bfra_009702 [Botrytis fragariae]KAF5870318.1 hypothetical protein Bfra_009702 [Botrytis fragariae]